MVGTALSSPHTDSVRAAFPHTALTLGVWYRSVRWDMDAGWVRLRMQLNPGHGVVQIVEPVTRRIEMHIVLKTRPD